MNETVLCGSSSIDIAFTGDRSAELSVPEYRSAADETFAKVIALWAQGNDTAMIAEALRIRECVAWGHVQSYLDQKYRHGWGSKNGG